MRRTLRIAAALVLMAFCASSAQAGSGWGRTRDAVMQLREKGRAAEAYALALAAKPSDAVELAERAFVAGWIAFRNLASPAQAVGHFRTMAEHAAGIGRSKEQRDAKAKAGYWLGEVLAANGKGDDARRLYVASAGFRDTFYGMISASKVGLTDTPSIMAANAGSYPAPQIYWHDQRIRRELVLAVVKAESSFRPTAVSGAGAKGLMQLMDGTAKAVGKRAGVAIDLDLVARNGNYNIAVGSRHMADLMVRYEQNLMLAAAAYNAGEKRVDEWLVRFGDPRRTVSSVEWAESIPFKETRDYVQKVGSNYMAYLAIASAGSR